MAENMSPRWIWRSCDDRQINQYVEFRREFSVDKIGQATLKLSADTNFVAWINGRFVGSGQFADYPDAKTFSSIDISGFLHPGENVLAVLVHYCGADHFSYIPGAAGLWFEIESGSTTIMSGMDTLFRVSKSYSQGDAPRLTPQMGFTFEYDAAFEDEWRSVDYIADEAWQPAVVCDTFAPPTQRPLPMLAYKLRVDAMLVAQGLFRRNHVHNATVAQLMQSDFLSARRAADILDDIPLDSDPVGSDVTILPEAICEADGCYLVYDLGSEQCGLVEIELESSAGVVVDIAVGEHLDDLRVRAAVGKRNFASRYTTKDGLNKFTHYGNRYAGRYVQLHLSNVTSAVKIRYAGIVPGDYPIEMKGAFRSADSLDEVIFETARRTMHLCMHEHYEDCPWREQALYANDARNQALAGYYAFGEYEFPRVCFDLLRRSFSSDGYQELCAPMKFAFTIPSFTMSWYMEMFDHMLYSGDVSSSAAVLPQMMEMLGVYESSLSGGLLPCPRGERYWHFYDWADGLCGSDVHPADGGITGERFDARFNFLYILALRSVSRIASASGRADWAEKCSNQADALLNAAVSMFWDDGQKAYKTYVGDQAIENHFAELTQSLALLCGAGDDSSRSELLSRLAMPDNGLVATTLSQSLYKFEALMQRADVSGPQVFTSIRDDWGKMIYSGATSFWETIRGGWDFCCAGSLCHGWSGIPAYFYGAYGLGVRPLENGFKTFRVAPVFDAFDKVDGVVPTPAGEIKISWQNAFGEIHGKLVYPESLRPMFAENIDLSKWQVAAAE